MLMEIDRVRRLSPWPFTVVVAAIATLFLPVAANYLRRYSIPLSSAAGIYCCFLLQVIYLIAPAMSAGRALLGKVIAGRYKALVILALLAFPYLLYAMG